MVKVASSKDLAVSPSFSPTQTPSERKLGLQSRKVPVPTFNINVRSEDEKIKSKKVRLAEGNHIINIASLENMLQMVSVCKKCKKGELQIFEDASRVTSASCLMIRCNACSNSKALWSVSGQFGPSKDIQSACEGALTKWNQMEVAAVLGSRVTSVTIRARKCRGMDDKLKKIETNKEEYDNWKKSHSNTCPANYPNLPIN